jgi:hypothetical protein
MDTEKLTLLSALVIAVAWLWREITTLNKKRDHDTEKWIDKLISLERDSVKAIEQNTNAMNRFTDVLREVKEKIS